MSNLYTKSSLLIKAVSCVLLGPLMMLLASLVDAVDPFVHILLASIPVGCLYTIPFWLTLKQFKTYRCSSIKSFALWDALSCLLPAVIGILFTEIVYTVISHDTLFAGFITLVFSAIFLAITFVFWLVYIVLVHFK